jgi:topoisomerase-4 subunit A
MVDIEGDGDIAALLKAVPGTKLLLASSDGRGFVTPAAGAIAETRKGKQVVNLRPGARLKVVRPIGPDDDYVAVVGENRKLVAYPLSELPEMSRGQGVQLQRYRDGGLSDATGFKLAAGLSWEMGGQSGRTRTEADLSLWRTARGAAGRPAPNGFPRDNRF